MSLGNDVEVFLYCRNKQKFGFLVLNRYLCAIVARHNRAGSRCIIR